MAFQVKGYENILDDMLLWVVNHASQITDTSPGSVIRAFCEATSIAIEEVYVSMYVGLREELEFLKENVFEFPRKSGTKATTTERFTRSGSVGTLTIDAGTRVKTDSGLRFLTTADATITAGNTTVDVGIEAEKVGTAYNVSMGTITTLEDDIDGIVSVTNITAAVNGVDEESDFNYHKRFQAYLEGLGRSNKAGLIAAALGVEGITSVSLVELIPAVGGVSVELYVDDGSPSGASAAKLTEVQLVIDGDGTEANPGARAAGVGVDVLAPSIQTQNFDLDVTILNGIDVGALRTDIDDAVTAYVNNLGVGDEFVLAEAIAAVMDVFGVYDVEFTTPAANVTALATQVIRVGTITATIVGTV